MVAVNLTQNQFDALVDYLKHGH
ncbi:hypothetical protein [Salmonella enterica]